MDIGISARLRPILDEVKRFIDTGILPLEREFLTEIASGDRWAFTPRQIEILEGLKARARSLGLWNFFLTEHDGGHGLTTVDEAIRLADLEGLYQELAADPNIRATMENARRGEPIPNIPETGKFFTAMDAALEAITNGRQAPKDALDGAPARIQVK